MSRLLVFLQYVLPRYWLTSMVYRIARIRHAGTKDFLIRRFIRLFDVDTADVRGEIPDDFATFNDFFVRELAAGARPLAASETAVVSPADGAVSQAGQLNDDRILQAKGREYSLDELLAIDLEDVRPFVNGLFVTIYLAPFNYHRVHAPLAGRLDAAYYVPGDLFSVNATSASVIPGLFRRNERLVMKFTTPAGPAILVLVGALNVGSIATPWSGEIRPRRKGIIEPLELDSPGRDIDKGDLLGWFNMGSTVIVLLPRGVGRWRDSLRAGASLRMGEAIGELKGNESQ